jgi:hypothetical protein
MTKKQEKVWAYKIKHPKASVSEIAKATKSSNSYVHKLMSKIGTPKDVLESGYIWTDEGKAVAIDADVPRETTKGKVARSIEQGYLDAVRMEEAEDTVRQAILDKAAYLIDGDRANEYGDAQDNFERIATYWNTHLGLIDLITPTDVGIMMTLLKVSRLHGEAKSIDSFVDVCGYMALAGEMAPARK